MHRIFFALLVSCLFIASIGSAEEKTITAKVNDKALFLVEAAQAGLFQIRNVPQQDMGPLLGIACPNTLFPYVRETIATVTTRAGFPPVVLAPMSFEGIYQQQLLQNQQLQNTKPN